MKRLISLLLALLMCFWMTSCGTATKQSVVEYSAAEGIDDEPDKVTVQENVLYEGHDTLVKVQETALNPGDFTHEINFYFENNSTLNLDYNIHSYSVNGIMADEQYYVMSTEVPAGKKATSSLSLSSDWLKENGIEFIEYIDILFWAYDTDKSFKEFETEVVRIQTSAFTQERIYQAVSPVYNESGIAVEPISVDGNEIQFVVLNTGTEYFDCDLTNASVNGWAYDTGIDVFSEQVLPGAARLCTVTVDEEFMEQNDIDTVEQFEFSLDVRPLGDHFNDFTVGPIVINN